MSDICTLFEKDYHLGLAALVNSLCRSKFQGTVWAGYRGALPPWAKDGIAGQDRYELMVGEKVRIVFLPVQTEAPLTNYKPDFMLQLMEHHCESAHGLFYFDPDIVVKCRWSFFEEWLSCGIPLCEDRLSPMYENHPVRNMWKDFAEQNQFQFIQSLDIYVNAGFIGVDSNSLDFLRLWSRIQECLPMEAKKLKPYPDRTYPFQRFDQDALNIAISCSPRKLSIIGKEGMDFIPSGDIMSHATGLPKPWGKNFALEALRGRCPSLADRSFFNYIESPIPLFSTALAAMKMTDLKLGCAIGRVIRRAF